MNDVAHDGTMYFYLRYLTSEGQDLKFKVDVADGENAALGYPSTYRYIGTFCYPIETIVSGNTVTPSLLEIELKDVLYSNDTRTYEQRE